MRHFVPVVLMAVALACAAGCGKKAPSPAPKPEAPAVPKPEQPKPAPEVPKPAAPVVAVPPKPAPAEPQTPFERELAKVIALENNAEFAQALIECRNLRTTTTDTKERAQLTEVMSRLIEEKRAAIGLDFAVDNLGSKDRTLIGAAERKLLLAGDAGMILLRKALRTKPDPIAIGAARVLASKHDPEARELIVQRIALNPKSPSLPDYLATLKVYVPRLTSSDLSALFGLVKNDADFSMRSVASILCDVFAKNCRKDRDKLNAAVGNELAYSSLKVYVERALVSKDAAVRTWAENYTALFGLYQKGVHGQYFHGINFETLAFEKLDTQIEVPERSFPYPDGRQDNISIRWTGFVQVDTPGDYTFYCASDDGQRMWVAGKQLVDNWTMQGVTEQSGKITLEGGLHAFKFEYMQGSGGAATKVYWSGPGLKERSVITSEHFRCKPFKETWKKK